VPRLMVKAPANGQRSIRTESSMQGASMTAAGRAAQGTSASLVATFDGKGVGLVATGAWIAERAAELEKIVDDAAGRYQTARSIDIDLGRLDRLDTFGAWLIERLNRAFTARGTTTRIIGLSDSDRGLMDEVRLVNRTAGRDTAAANRILVVLDSIGRAVAEMGASLALLAHLLGALTMVVLGTIAHPARLRLTSLVNHLERVGWRAVPIVALSTFLIGAIIAQQGIFHFRTFGAEVYVVDMVGILVLREVGVLIVCVMVAGRSGSAYTAELGSMKMREEIDALRTMGFDPIEVLILPRMLALIIALPILAFIGAMAALYGGGLVAWLYGGVDPEAFLLRLRDAISIDHFTVGIIKAPVMAAVIGLVACVEGLAVEGSAESLGQHTTSSVVKGIFFVIVMDGVFAIFFASIGM
jgi:phospholipid/cholesterol/gamma-HCH transport system permease protein